MPKAVGTSAGGYGVAKLDFETAFDLESHDKASPMIFRRVEEDLHWNELIPRNGTETGIHLDRPPPLADDPYLWEEVTCADEDLVRAGKENHQIMPLGPISASIPPSPEAKSEEVVTRKEVLCTPTALSKAVGNAGDYGIAKLDFEAACGVESHGKDD